jgi:hypothetical protein
LRRVRLLLLVGPTLLVASSLLYLLSARPADIVVRDAGAVLVVLTLPAYVVWKLMSHLRESRKRCPDCAELVRNEAAVCRFCGHRFAVVSGGARPATTVDEDAWG